MTWLSQINPNVAATLLLALLGYLYHVLLSPAAQAKVTAAIKDAMALADRAVGIAVTLAPPGTTAAQLEAELLSLAKAQLAHAGLDPDKLPAPALALVKALVAQGLAQWKANTAASPIAPVVTLPAVVLSPVATPAAPVAALPLPPPPPAGKPGFIDLRLAAGLALLAISIATFAIGTSSCATTQKMTGAFEACETADLGQILTNVPAQLAADLKAANVTPEQGLLADLSALVKANGPALEADLETILVQVGLTALDCAYVAIEAVLGSSSATGSGSGSTAEPAPGGVQRFGNWLAKKHATK
jgi:hypothetical protein